MNISMISGALLFACVIAFQVMYTLTTLIQTHSRKHRSVNRYLDEITISILIPAYNEESVLSSCIDGLRALNYTNCETIFINDGSSDNTLHVLIQLLELELTEMNPNYKLKYAPIKNIYVSKIYPNMIVIDKFNGGKADSLNAGGDYATGEVVITLDADSILESDSLLHINESFHDNKIIAAGGMVHVGQMFDKQGKPTFKGNFLLKYQISEYISSFYVRKFTQSKFNMLSIVSGAFGAFRRDVLYQIDGYKKTLGEDMEITMNIQKFINTTNKDYRMVFIPKAECYTEIPENLADVFKQKTRWQKGFIDSIMKYRQDFFRGLSAKFTLFLFWDALGMALLGLITIAALPLIFIFGEATTFYISCLAISLSTQFLSRVIAFWAAAKYSHRYKRWEYVMILLFFIIELPIRPIFDSSMFLYGTLSYYFLKDKHNWNKVKRLGNVTIIDQEVRQFM